MKADRLLSILLILQNNGKMTSRSLSEQLEVSERTINRDMEALSAAGIPVYAERGLHGGWRLSEQYQTKLTGMKREELMSLLISNPDNLLADLGIRRHYKSAFQKLLASSPDSIRKDAEMVRSRIHIDGAGWSPVLDTLACLSTVQDAVWLERKLSIRYKREDRIVERVVHPLGLIAKRNVWYVAAESEGDIRTYRISRLLDAKMLEDSFERPADFHLAQYWEASMNDFKQNLPRYPAVLLIEASRLNRLERERYVKIINYSPYKKHWLKAEVQFDTLESACEIILSHGPYIQVSHPEELKERVISQANQILKQYEQINKQLN
ncbi:helix-turn-helix transcriptional regulator [Paenibacillus dakarensis]|uniref:helix-turn-helix transcriptional regulator n=1 Tax=Paenibacillus dakarensis TaxID=1527293 RepID=UPI0006D56840|nr:YafY family protein [Paenibacillus dakarensis]